MLNTGIRPDGKSEWIPSISSKFRDKNSLMEATELVKPGTPAFQQKLLSVKDNTPFSFSVPAGRSMGYGYAK